MAKHRAHHADIHVRRNLLAGACAAVLLTGLGVGASAASADPITCPNGQTSVHTDSGWACQNNGGNLSNADETKNPNT